MTTLALHEQAVDLGHRLLLLGPRAFLLAAIIYRVGVEHAPVYLARLGRHVAAVIDADDLDRILVLAEDMADIRAAEEAHEEMRATGEALIPWEQVKADLGLA